MSEWELVHTGNVLRKLTYIHLDIVAPTIYDFHDRLVWAVVIQFQAQGNGSHFARSDQSLWYYTANTSIITHGMAKILLKSMKFWQLVEDGSLRSYLPVLTTKVKDRWKQWKRGISCRLVQAPRAGVIHSYLSCMEIKTSTASTKYFQSCSIPEGAKYTFPLLNKFNSKPRAWLGQCGWRLLMYLTLPYLGNPRSAGFDLARIWRMEPTWTRELG